MHTVYELTKHKLLSLLHPISRYTTRVSRAWPYIQMHPLALQFWVPTTSTYIYLYLYRVWCGCHIYTFILYTDTHEKILFTHLFSQSTVSHTIQNELCVLGGVYGYVCTLRWLMCVQQNLYVWSAHLYIVWHVYFSKNVRLRRRCVFIIASPSCEHTTDSRGSVSTIKINNV